MTDMTPDAINPAFQPSPRRLNRAAFVARFGAVYEHAPWVAERAWDTGLSDAADRVEGLATLLRAPVAAAGRERQLALLRAHPDLAGKLGRADELTAASRTEQAGAGLDACTPAEYARFRQLNADYHRRFGFPFILAVAGRQRAAILTIFTRRLAHGQEEEFAEALEQVHRIALFRLRALAATEAQPGKTASG